MKKEEKLIEELIKVNILLGEAINDGAFPGCSYAIVTKDSSYLGVLGNKANYPVVEQNTKDVIYDLASLSKVIGTTSAIMKMVEDGLISLCDRVNMYLKRFKYNDIRIWHLLTHTSGLPADIKRAKHLQNQEEVEEKVYNMDLINETGKKIVYSDIGFILLAFIIEERTKGNISDYLKDKIFKPLEMVDTCYNPVDVKRCAPTEYRDDDIFKGMLRGRVHDEKAFALGGIAGHAGLFSTHKDISKFINMILNNGVYKGKQILSKLTIDLMFKEQFSDSSTISNQKLSRALGWDLNSVVSSSGDLTSYETILHTGYTGTNMFIDRKNQIGFVLLTNRVHPTRDNLKIIRVRPKIANLVLSGFVE